MGQCCVRTGVSGQVLRERASKREQTLAVVTTSPATGVKTKGKVYRSRRVAVRYQVTPMFSLSSGSTLMNLPVMIPIGINLRATHPWHSLKSLSRPVSMEAKIYALNLVRNESMVGVPSRIP